jgi:hypothetical protein
VGRHEHPAEEVDSSELVCVHTGTMSWQMKDSHERQSRVSVWLRKIRVRWQMSNSREHARVRDVAVGRLHACPCAGKISADTPPLSRGCTAIKFTRRAPHITRDGAAVTSGADQG